MDPFSITAGAIGIAGVTTTGIVQLHKFVDGLAGAKDEVQDISSDLESIEHLLPALQQLTVSDEVTSAAAKEDLEKAGVAEAIKKCNDACEKFTKKLEKWTKHSCTARLSFRDRFSVGVWNKEQIRTFRTQLQSCKTTVHFAVTSTKLMIQLRSEKTSEADRESLREQLQTLQTTIQEHNEHTTEQQNDAQRRLQELQVEDDGSAEFESAIREVESRLRVLEADQVSCGVVFTQAESTRSGIDIGKVLTSDNSIARVGIPESVVGKVNLRIREVTTKQGSTSDVGVFGKR